MKRFIDELKATPSMWSELKNEKGVVLYGMGDGAVKLLSILEKRGIKCLGVFASDDFVRYQDFMGFTVKKLSDLEAELDSFVVLSAFATRLEDVMENFRNINRRHILRIPDINVSGDHTELFDEDFLSKHTPSLIRLYDALDEIGKEMLKALISYKYTGKLEWLDRLEEIRRVSDMPYDKDSIHSFADFGAYTGDTILEATALYPKLEKIAGYEPDPKTFQKLLRNTEGLNCSLFNALVWNDETELVLRSGGAMNTIIEKNVPVSDNLQKKKSTLVKALTGDGSLPFLPDLIKMDVEGCESNAIAGCARIISESNPVLRISVYHNHRDLFELYEQIHLLNKDYRYTLRQKCRYIPAWDVELVAY